MADLREITSEPPAENIVPLLEQIIKRAKAGELSSVAVAMVTREGATGQEWSRLPSVGAMIGSVATLQHRLIERLLD
jgi:hypothetical protein